MNNQKLWSKKFIVHTSAYWVMAMSFYFLIPTLPEYVINDLGLDESQVGLIIGFYAFSALAIRPISGLLFDRYGRKYLYLGSLLMFSLIMAAYNLAYTFAILLFIRLIHGAIWGILTTGGSTIAADIIPEKRRGEGIGFFGLSFTLSMALGPSVGLWILDGYNFSTLFWTSFGVALMALILSLTIDIPKISSRGQRFRIGNMIDKKVAPVAAVMIVMAFPFAGIMSFIVLFGKEMGIEEGGMFFLVYALGVSTLRPVAGRVMDKSGPRGVIAACLSLSFIGSVILASSTSYTMYLVSAFITGLGNGLIMPVMQTMVINMVPPQRRGVANSTLFSGIDLGFGIGSYFLGILAETFSLRTMFWFNAFILIIPGLYFFLFALKYYQNNLYISETSE